MSLPRVPFLIAILLLSGILPGRTNETCLHCGGQLAKVGTVKDDITKPSKNINVWNRSICANPFYGDDSIICTQCWLAHSTRFQRWERSSEVPASFHRPLSTVIRDFPIPSAKDIKSLVVYSQQISGTQVTESVVFWCTDSNSLISSFRAYASKHSLSLRITPQDRVRHEVSVSVTTKAKSG